MPVSAQAGRRLLFSCFFYICLNLFFILIDLCVLFVREFTNSGVSGSYPWHLRSTFCAGCVPQFPSVCIGLGILKLMQLLAVPSELSFLVSFLVVGCVSGILFSFPRRLQLRWVHTAWVLPSHFLVRLICFFFLFTCVLPIFVLHITCLMICWTQSHELANSTSQFLRNTE